MKSTLVVWSSAQVRNRRRLKSLHTHVAKRAFPPSQTTCLLVGAQLSTR